MKMKATLQGVRGTRKKEKELLEIFKTEHRSLISDLGGGVRQETLQCYTMRHFQNRKNKTIQEKKDKSK